MTDHDRLRELANNATPGPWERGATEHGEHALFVYVDHHDGYAKHLVANRLTGEDAEFIAAANPSVVLGLLDRIDTLVDQVRNQAEEIALLRRGQGRAPAPAAAGPVPVALHEAHPIPDSTRKD